MARKKKPPEHENHERWLVSYADFITLLFAFFVVMFASSQVDKGKAAQVSESVRKALEKGNVAAVVAAVLGGTVGDTGPGNAQRKGPGGAKKQAKEPNELKGTDEQKAADLAASHEVLLRELDEEIRGGQVKLEMQQRGLVVSLRQAAFFPSGEDTIAPATFPVLGKIAGAVAKLPNPVRLEGHTDSVPIHNVRFRSNWDLSVARSIAMLELLTTRFSIPPVRLSVAGYADTAPTASNDEEAGRALNRRVDLVILNQEGMKGEPRKH